MHFSSRFSLLTAFAIALALFVICDEKANAQEYAFDGRPINYSRTVPTDPIANLYEKVVSGDLTLTYEANRGNERGFLKSLLKELEIDESSQVLVFSKTSLQDRYITPETPRAIYFNDNVYVAWIPGAPHIEIASVDSVLGGVFYQLIDRNRRNQGNRRSRRNQQRENRQLAREIEQPENDQQAQEIVDITQPSFRRGDCMRCHATRRTDRIPGFFVRSIFPEEDGTIIMTLGTTDVDHTTPFEERFGGWYVTGQHGSMRHRGNGIADREADPPIDMEQYSNINSIDDRLDISRYLQPSSDIVAQMVLAHQTIMHNKVTKAAYVTRTALHEQQSLNEAADRDSDFISDAVHSRIDEVAADLVRYLLFSNELPLTDRIEGRPEYAEHFQSQGPVDSQGRSLRQFDMQTRMFKYPCSFLIYSESFDALPPLVLDRVLTRLLAVLQGEDTSEEFQHLSADDRQAILEILCETKPLIKERVN